MKRNSYPMNSSYFLDMINPLQFKDLLKVSLRKALKRAKCYMNMNPLNLVG